MAYIGAIGLAVGVLVAIVAVVIEQADVKRWGKK